jgi:hypothetical protein
MKKIIGFCLLTASLICIPWVAKAADPVKVEVLYMAHGPLQDTLAGLKKVFSQYNGKVAVSWYDFDSKEGEAFMAKKNIKQHVPLVIWMNNQSTFKVDGKDTLFSGFPTGAGPASFQGKWTNADVQKVLDQLTRGK